MGLDMYLEKAKRINGATAADINNIEDYFGWKLRPEKYANTTMKEWCGVSVDDVDMELVDLYRPEYQTRYSAWDKEHKYGHLRLWDGVAYWRKANAIHNWFVENAQDGVDNCGTYEVERYLLEDLLARCAEVKKESVLVDGDVSRGQTLTENGWTDIWERGKVIKNPQVAEWLLPTTDGFFFGDTSYDEDYMRDIDYTIDVITRLLNETDFNNEIVAYTASW